MIVETKRKIFVEFEMLLLLKRVIYLLFIIYYLLIIIYRGNNIDITFPNIIFIIYYLLFKMSSNANSNLKPNVDHSLFLKPKSTLLKFNLSN